MRGNNAILTGVFAALALLTVSCGGKTRSRSISGSAGSNGVSLVTSSAPSASAR